MRRSIPTLLAAACLCLLACSARAQDEEEFEVEVAFPNLAFDMPVDLQHAGDGSGRLFVVEQRGVVRVFANDRGASEAGVFLDIRDRVQCCGETGLLGLAFHPRYEENGYFFVNYTAGGPLRTVVARYRVDPADPDRADPGSATVILEVAQPYANHNGGQTSFGPDGYLYVALGDGGLGGDPQGHGQNPATLLGSILRLDVDRPSGGRSYGIPPDNPFVGNTQGYREEIFAYGLRNPWRFSFDPPTGRLWVADVGQGAYEEINVVTRGGNYGWDVMEGRHCHEPSSGCSAEGLVLPVWEYGRAQGQSVTGGFVYRGANAPALQGRYVYGDYGSGRIWALAFDGTTATDNREVARLSAISSFGVDESGELYILHRGEGRVYWFAPTGSTAREGEEQPKGAHLLQPGFPNPFRTATTVTYALARAARVDLGVFDVLGRRVRTLVRQAQPAGTHTVTWDGLSDAGLAVPGGVYLCTLRADDALAGTGRLVRVE